jgi:hypothetical protein
MLNVFDIRREESVVRNTRTRSRPDAAPVLLGFGAVMHAFLAVRVGLSDGDYSLLWLAAPLMALTGLAAGFAARRAPWAAYVALVLTSVVLVLALLLLPIFLVGLFHLPQAVFGVIVAARHLPES